MNQKREKMKKLSESLKELSDHVANTENKVAAAEQETKVKVEVALQKSKADANARQADFKDHIQQEQAEAVSLWEDMQNDFSQRLQQIKNKRETETEAREVKKAKQRAEDAEADAVTAIGFAILAIDEAEVAVLESLDADAYAEALA
jgi:hypothetical protein